MAIFERKFIIGVTDIGKKRELKNRAIIRIFQDVAGMHSEQVHFGINDIKRTRQSWIILNWKIQVKKRPTYNEEVIVKTWIRNANKISMYRDFALYDNSGKLLVIGTSKWALIDIDTKELVPLSRDVILLYGEEKDSIFEEKTVDKIKEPAQYSSVIQYKIPREDIDINEHVHNLYYLDMAYEALPDKIYNKKECDNFEILYKKQIKIDDKIACFYAFENNQNYIVIKSEDQKTLHAIIKLY